MKTLAVILLTMTVACATLAQDDPIETRRFATGFLTMRPADSSGISLGLAMDSIGTAVAAGESYYGMLSYEDLVSTLKRDVAPKSWEQAGHSLEWDNGELIVTNHKSVVDAVSAWLENARVRHGRRIVVDAALVVVPFERWGRVAPRELAQGAAILKTGRLLAGSGQRVVIQDLTQLSYIRDHDVQIASAVAALDPVVDVLNTGVRIELRPRASQGEEFILLEVRCEAAAMEALEDKPLKLRITQPVQVPVAGGGTGVVAQTDWEGLLQLPHVTLDRIRGQIVARPGETVIAAAASRADGMLALLLTPSFAGEAVPAGGPSTRLYDVGAITSKIQDWAAPHAELVSPQRGGGGPLTGATFTLDEPREGYNIESLTDELRVLVDPADTPPEKSALNSNYAGTLSVRGNAETHAVVEKRLREVFLREVRSVTTEALVLAFKPDARAEWAKSVPALAPGGMRAADAEVTKLLEAVGKGPGLRIAALLSVSGRPHQRVHVLSGREQAYIQDYEPQVGGVSACFDPILGILLTGTGLDACPKPHAGAGTSSVQFCVWTLSGEMMEEKRLSTDVSVLQRPKVSGFLWRGDVVCVPGQWTLAALESRGTGAAAEEFALFVRVR